MLDSGKWLDWGKTGRLGKTGGLGKAGRLRETARLGKNVALRAASVEHYKCQELALDFEFFSGIFHWLSVASVGFNGKLIQNAYIGMQKRVRTGSQIY